MVAFSFLFERIASFRAQRYTDEENLEFRRTAFKFFIILLQHDSNVIALSNLFKTAWIIKGHLIVKNDVKLLALVTGDARLKRKITAWKHSLNGIIAKVSSEFDKLFDVPEELVEKVREIQRYAQIGAVLREVQRQAQPPAE